MATNTNSKKNTNQELNTTPTEVVSNDTKKSNLSNIVNDALNTPIKEMALNQEQENMSQDQAEEIITKLADLHNLLPATAFAAIAILFLNGASNKGAPLSMHVKVLTKEGTEKNITKDDILHIYSTVTGNKYLRRLAQALATEISQFAEKNNLDGDLAKTIEPAIMQDEDLPLSAQERAWASSFNQNNKKALELCPRVVSYLARDYHKRFSKLARKNKKTIRKVQVEGKKEELKKEFKQNNNLKNKGNKKETNPSTKKKGYKKQ